MYIYIYICIHIVSALNYRAGAARAGSAGLVHAPEDEQPKHSNDIFIPKTDISIAEPIEAQIDELGDDTIQMYRFIGIINDEKVGGLESLFNYMNE